MGYIKKKLNMPKNKHIIERHFKYHIYHDLKYDFTIFFHEYFDKEDVIYYTYRFIMYLEKFMVTKLNIVMHKLNNEILIHPEIPIYKDILYYRNKYEKNIINDDIFFYNFVYNRR